MNVQIIREGDSPQYAVVPYDDYIKLVEDAEMLADIQDYDAAKLAIENGEETIPAELVFAILDGANPIKTWREYRHISQKSLAEQVKISTAYLSQIESGKRTGNIDLLRKIADALGLSLDDLA